ncbi:DUF7351 domain-containing protein [Halobaculum marinum]|uniref:DUF7351 domain-containing protein n=1 Tax=Halobaculum marinum TaxID=3031996 RepID=UPI0036F1C55F
MISFYWRWGIDASTLPLWDLPSYVDNWEVDAVETDPYEFRVTIVHDGESLRVRVDDELHVDVSDDPCSGSTE